MVPRVSVTEMSALGPQTPSTYDRGLHFSPLPTHLLPKTALSPEGLCVSWNPQSQHGPGGGREDLVRTGVRKN